MNAHNKIVDIDRLNRFIDWFINAKESEHYVYFTGLLAKAREYDIDKQGKKIHDLGKAEINHLADRLWRLHEEKKVFLVQRRVSPYVCDYIAIRGKL